MNQYILVHTSIYPNFWHSSALISCYSIHHGTGQYNEVPESPVPLDYYGTRRYIKVQGFVLPSTLLVEAVAAPRKIGAADAPANKGTGREVTKLAAGPAAVDWNTLELVLVWLDAVVSNTALLARQNCSSQSSRRAAYPDWIVRISTCHYVPACTI
jgi:hypothetical protein